MVTWCIIIPAQHVSEVFLAAQVIDSKPPQCRQRSRCATPEAEPSSPVCDGVDTASAFQPAAAVARLARKPQPSRHLRRSMSPPTEAPDKRNS
jgi:hypothetical protein